MSRTTTNLRPLILAFSGLALLPGKWTPEAPFELPVIWEQKIAKRNLFGFGPPPGPPSCLPAISEDRSVYVSGEDGVLYAFSGNGSQSWKYDTRSADKKNDPFGSAINGVVIDSNGTIYAASNGLFALNNDGVMKWSLWSDSRWVTSAPALGAGDRIYVIREESLYAITPEGEIEWSREINTPRWSRRDQSAPVVGRDGTVYVTGAKPWHDREPGLLFAFEPDGTLKWTFQSKDIWRTPALDEKGTIYLVGTEGLYAVDKKGRLRWVYDTQNFRSYSTPAVSSDHVIYFGLDSYLFAIGPDGKFKWRFETGNAVRSSPAIDDKGNIWFGSSDGKLYCVDRQGTLVGAWPIEGARYATPLIARHGEIYLRDSRSIQVLRGPNGPGNCPWPMARHDAQNTGRF